jgi:pyrroline-5-carboxylate reductase
MAQETLLVGCGKMGGAMLQGWIERGSDPAAITIVEPMQEATEQARGRFGVQAVGDGSELADDYSPEIVIFAVKPQELDAIAPLYRRFTGAGTVFMSIAAGKPIGFFEQALGAAAAIVRCMPNTPAAVQRGITAACANGPVSDAQRALCQGMLEAVGEVVWVGDEALIDPVTALSGSGPAYVFLMIECMAEAGIAAGLPADIAARLARATVAGSGELARQSDEPADQLRRNVTSPGGTTEAALSVLMADEDGLQQLMTRALDAATRRSRELAG